MISKIKLTWLLRATFSLSLLVVLFRLVAAADWEGLALQVSLPFAAIAGLSFIFIGVLDAWRVEKLLPSLRKARIKNTRISYLSVLAAQLPLGAVGSDVYRAAAYKQLGITTGKAVFAISLCRYVGLICTASVGLFGAVLLLSLPLQRDASNATLVWLFMLVFGVIVFGLVAALLVLRRFNFTNSRARLIRTLVDSLAQVSFGLIWRVSAISMSLTFVRLFALWMSALALGLSLSSGLILVAFAAGNLSTIIPISLAGVGLRELSIVGTVSAFGHDLALVVLAAFLFRLAALVGTCAGFILIKLWETLRERARGGF